MKINIEEVVRYFDDTPSGGHATSVVGLIGEELNASVFKHYMENVKNAEVDVLEDIVTTGHNKGSRLDRWIYVKENNKEILYQCEIKNWSSTAIGGANLKLDADLSKKIEVSNYYWNNEMKVQYSNKKFPGKVTKVFLDNMKRPKDKYLKAKISPLVIYWMPIQDDKSLNPFFTKTVAILKNPKIKTSFKKFEIFSVSLYLRSLLENGSSKIIDLDLPKLEERFKILDKIIIK